MLKKRVDWIQFLSAVLVMVFLVVPLITGLPEKDWGEWTIGQLLTLPLVAVWYSRYIYHH